jgi:hypothetical protein
MFEYVYPYKNGVVFNKFIKLFNNFNFIRNLDTFVLSPSRQESYIHPLKRKLYIHRHIHGFQLCPKINYMGSFNCCP